MTLLFSPLTLRRTSFKNRVWVAAMCQYSSEEGMPTDWHLVHYGAMARGGAGLVMTEATAVHPEGRISQADAGIWTDEQAVTYRRITDFIRAQGAQPAIQLAHAGRKASVTNTWSGNSYVGPADGGWEPVAPSPIAYPDGDKPVPRELTAAEVQELVESFAFAASRAVGLAGFEVIEIHAAHGYLIHEFLSPLTNRRDDAYGGSLEGRCKFLLDIVKAVREAVGPEIPVLVRFSATDWIEGGWSVEDTVQSAQWVRREGADLADISTAGLSTEQDIRIGPGYQVPFARQVKRAAGMATAAVGLITDPRQAEQILVDQSADVIMLGRELLRNPHWPLWAAHQLEADVAWPNPYHKAKFRRSAARI
ncbi:NADH:flavin oxidoreductase/NADH oxidase [Arthrobacter ginkgonis]|uniref:NADH:flavin oxidoreductase/NADH oxidase n=1 Tax=Arthrobacter ginkgonis TaxID=1630594 RepID=A0ABP7DKP0_9MICC